MEKIVKNNDVELWTESFGAPSDPACLLISGAGAHARFWSDFFCDTLVQKRYFVIRFDLRDTGLSSAVQFSTHPYTIADLAEDVLKILAEYNIKKAHLIGHSMGGYVGQYVASHHPERVLSLTSISAGPLGATPIAVEEWTKEEQELLSKTWSIMVQNKPTKKFDESIEGYLTVWKYLNGDFGLDDESARSYTRDGYERSNHKPGVAMSHLSVMRGVATKLEERSGDMKKIQAPTLVIHGEKDYLVPVRRGGEATAEGIVGSKLEIVPGMGHMIFNRELEEKLVTLIADHLSSVSSD